MKKDNQVYLKDISESIGRIESYVAGSGYDEFSKNLMMQDAIIRQFEIIGEAAGKLSEDFLKDHSDFPAREAAAMRNLLIHEYNYVNIDQIWKTVQEDLPKLKEKIAGLI